MNTFIQFINEEKQRRGLSTAALFEANKLYVFKNGSRWLVESSDEEHVEATEEETAEQKQFASDEFAAQVDSAATEVVQKQKTLEQQQKQAAQTLQQIAMQKIAQGQSICDGCEEADKEEFAQGQQLIKDGHELLKQAQEAQEEIAAQEAGEEVSAQVQSFQKAAQQVQDSVKILGTVINDLIPPSEQITIPQLAKQSEILVRANAIASSASDVFQTAVQKQQQIIDQADEELKAELASQMACQLKQEEECVLSKEQQKLKAVEEELQKLVDVADEGELEVVKQCAELVQQMSKVVDTITDETFKQGEVELKQNEEASEETEAEVAAEIEQPAEVEEAAEEQELQPTELFQQKLEKAKECFVAQQVAMAQSEEVEEGKDEKIQKVVDMIDAAQKQIEDDANIEDFAQSIDELVQQVQELKQAEDEAEQASHEDILAGLEEIKQILSQFLDGEEAQEQAQEEEVQEETQEAEEEQQVEEQE